MNRRYIIIEDERLAYEELKRMMALIRPNYTLTGWGQSVEQAVMLLRGGNFDLILLDIQLSDGLCFEIFEQCPSDVAVIFTTAYDDYALKAFKLNSVDYLLKPIDESELNAALEKYERHSTNTGATFDSSRLESSYLSGNGKSRFLVQVGDTFRHVQTEDIAYFYSEDKYVFLHLFTGKRYIINYTLEQLDTLLSQKQFFRVSRNFIVNIRSVNKITKFFAGKMELHLQPEPPQDVMVSRRRSRDFLKWMDELR